VRGLVLRLHESLGDALAQRRHRHDLVARIELTEALVGGRSARRDRARLR